MKTKLRFRGPNVIQKFDDRLKKLINIIEYTICKRCLDVTGKPEVGRCQVMTVDIQSKCMTFPSLQKDFRQQGIHRMTKEVLGVEIPPGRITSTT